MLDRKTLIENLENIVSILETVGAIAAAQDARDAIDLIESQGVKTSKPTFVWTSNKPKVPGLYACRLKDDQTEDAGLFTEEDIANSSRPPYSVWYAMREFAGPFIIAEPTPESGGVS